MEAPLVLLGTSGALLLRESRSGASGPIVRVVLGLAPWAKKGGTQFKAEFETAKFTLEAYGESIDEALEALRKGWDEHVRQTGAVVSWDEVEQDATVQLVTSGGCYRDGTLMFRV